MTEVLDIPKIEIYKELWKRRNFKRFATRDGKTHLKQIQALELLTDTTTSEFAYGGAAGGAKSWTGATWLAMMCLCYPDTRWFIGREELKRLRESTLITFFKVAKRYQITGWKYNGQDHFIQFENGSRIDLLELKYLPSDPLYERYGSTEYTGGWIEEGGEVNFGAYDTLKSRIGRQRNEEYGILAKIFLTLNPKKNWVYDYFWKLFKENRLPIDRKFLQALAHDNPFNDSGYLKQLQGLTGIVRRERLLEGNFDYDDDPLKMMEYDKILELFTNSFIKPTTDKYLIGDIAYEGSDLFVIGYWEGLVLKEITAIEKCDELHIAPVFNELRMKHKVPQGNVLYDADGLKKFVQLSARSGYLQGAKQFHNGAKPLNDENYYNLKSQCYFKAAELINNNFIYIEEKKYRDQIIKECEQIKKIEGMDEGKLRVEKKADLKIRLGHSPDFFDMIAMRCFFELKPNYIRSAGGSRRGY